MKLFLLFPPAARGRVAVAALAGLVSGACSAALIALINTALHGTEASLISLVVIFAGLGLVKLTTTALSQVLLTRISQRTIADLRNDLTSKILAAPLRRLEDIGSPRLIAALAEDVDTIADMLRNIPSFVVNITILAGCSVYLGWLSWNVFLATLGFIILAILTYRAVVSKSTYRLLKLAREDQDALFGHFRALTEGIKELKLHRERRDAFRQEVHATTTSFQHHNVSAMTRYVGAHSLVYLFIYALIGLILFALPTLKDVGMLTLTGYILVILYAMGPLGSIMSAIPMFGRANIALGKIRELGLSLATTSSEDSSTAHAITEPTWHTIELAGVTHSYHGEEGDNSFVLGPIDLTIRRGELVFLTGSNGSGKTTLAKVLTGLYPPASGEVRLNGESITDFNRDAYRQLFSAVFSDYYLFEKLLGLSAPDLNAQARDYLIQLQLDHRVEIVDGVLSTTDLSHGQRKRLALLTAYLEDRPIYVFDEWASDQDPRFREIFYFEFLSKLKRNGKTVLVITHDDRYFHLADRLVSLEDGNITEASSELKSTPLKQPGLEARQLV